MAVFVDFYEVLRVDPSATVKEIRKAYRARVQELHPDRNGGAAHAHDHMVLLNRAVAALKDPAQRKQHDGERLRERAQRLLERLPKPAPIPKPAPKNEPPVLQLYTPRAAQPSRQSSGGGFLVGLGIGMGVLGTVLLAMSNDYDRDVGRYRDRRGRFRQGRFS